MLEHLLNVLGRELVTDCHIDVLVDAICLTLLSLLQDVEGEEVPEVQADLKQLHIVLDVSALDQVVQSFLGALPQGFDILVRLD